VADLAPAELVAVRHGHDDVAARRRGWSVGFADHDEQECHQR
jgi:hypothetical protein